MAPESRIINIRGRIIFIVISKNTFAPQLKRPTNSRLREELKWKFQLIEQVCCECLIDDNITDNTAKVEDVIHGLDAQWTT